MLSQYETAVISRARASANPEIDALVERLKLTPAQKASLIRTEVVRGVTSKRVKLSDEALLLLDVDEARETEVRLRKMSAALDQQATTFQTQVHQCHAEQREACAKHGHVGCQVTSHMARLLVDEVLLLLGLAEDSVDQKKPKHTRALLASAKAYLSGFKSNVL
jgi:hypothetical protein